MRVSERPRRSGGLGGTASSRAARLTRGRCLGLKYKKETEDLSAEVIALPSTRAGSPYLRLLIGCCSLS